MKIKELIGPSKSQLQPQTPEQARLNSLQQNIENGKRALQTEKDAQRRRKEQLRQARRGF